MTYSIFLKSFNENGKHLNIGESEVHDPLSHEDAYLQLFSSLYSISILEVLIH